jgi:hypothetical protein
MNKGYSFGFASVANSAEGYCYCLGKRDNHYEVVATFADEVLAAFY